MVFSYEPRAKVENQCLRDFDYSTLLFATNVKIIINKEKLNNKLRTIQGFKTPVKVFIQAFKHLAFTA